MSMHKIPLTPLEETGLKAHGLRIGQPSQLADVFRQGVAWAQSQVPVMGPAVAITDAGKIMQLVWAYGDAMYQHGRCRNDNDECPHYSEAQDVLAMFEPLLTNPTSITAAELEAKDARIKELEEALEEQIERTINAQGFTDGQTRQAQEILCGDAGIAKERQS